MCGHEYIVLCLVDSGDFHMRQCCKLNYRHTYGSMCVWVGGHIRWNYDYDLFSRFPNVLPLNRSFYICSNERISTNLKPLQMLQDHILLGCFRNTHELKIGLF